MKFEHTNKSKKQIIEDLAKLQLELEEYLRHWKKYGGGTKGHAIGSMIKKTKALKTFFEAYC